MGYVCEGRVKDYTYFSTKLDIDIKALIDALRAKDMKKALVHVCTAMHNLHMIYHWIQDNDKDE